jgi:hypothetical protein
MWRTSSSVAASICAASVLERARQSLCRWQFAPPPRRSPPTSFPFAPPSKARPAREGDAPLLVKARLAGRGLGWWVLEENEGGSATAEGLRRAMSLLLDDGTCGFMTVWGAWQHGLLGAGMAWHGGLAHGECIRVPTAVRVRMVHQSLGPGSLPWIRASHPIMVHPRRKDDRGRLGTTIGRWIVGSVSVCFRPPSRPPDLEFIPILVIHVSSGLGSMPQSNRTPCSLFSIMPLRVLVLNVCSSSSETWTRHVIIQNFLPLVSELHPETGSQHIFPLP